MGEQLKKIPEAIKNFWTNLSTKLKIALIAGIVVVIATALVLSLAMNKTEYVTIYEDLSESETSEILAALQGAEVDVRVVNGDSIQVPAENETAVRMALATQGYPKSGLSYYVIEGNSGMLTTDYERKQYETMQLQERLGASIETLEGVKQAIVTIAKTEESIFYLTEKTEPTASVVVHMKDDYELDQTQIDGIRNLVASAVPGLTIDNVSMTDGMGNDLIVDEKNYVDGKRTKLKNEVESAIKKKIEHLLSGPYGNDHFKVSVTATVNTDNLVKEELTYYPSDPLGIGNNTGVTHEETHATDNYSSTEVDGGVPGTSTNADVTTYPVQDGRNESSSSSTSDNIKYDVSYVKTLLEKNGAYIEDISIGVVIDKSSFDPGERENLLNLISKGSGIPEDNVTVQGFKFYEEEPEPTPPEEGFFAKYLYFIIGAAILLLAIAIVIILRLRARKKELERLALEEAERLAREQALAEAFGEEEQEAVEEAGKIERVEDRLIDEIRDFTNSNPEVAAQMIKSLLRADEER